MNKRKIMLLSMLLCVSRKAKRVGRLEISSFGLNAQIRGARRRNGETRGVTQDDAL